MATEVSVKLKLLSSRVQDCANPIMEDEDSSAKQRRPGTVDRFLKSESPTSEPPGKHGFQPPDPDISNKTLLTSLKLQLLQN